MRLGFDLNLFLIGFKWRRVCSFYEQVGLHKNLEFEVFFNPGMILNLGLEVKTRTTDHAGFTVEVGVWPLNTTLTFYDSRHADAR